MWRRSNSSETLGGALGRIAALCVLSLAPLTTSCVKEEIIEPGEPISMGPWTFEVVRATDRIETRGYDRYKKVTVILELHNYMERHEKPFDDFLNGTSKKSIMAFPHLLLVDDEGTPFDGWVSPVSGGSMRSERWNAEFLLVPANSPLLSDASDAAAEHLDKRISELRLVIQNPDRRGSQASQVSVPLG